MATTIIREERYEGPTSDDVYRVLLSGYTPFGRHIENNSWLAVAPLNNQLLELDVPDFDDQMEEDVDSDDPDSPSDFFRPPRLIHITSLILPVTYQGVLELVPPLHARPPIILPASQDPAHPVSPPPESGYDLIFHIGLAGRGGLRLERGGHKTGYKMKDSIGEHAPIVTQPSGDQAAIVPDADAHSDSNPSTGAGASPNAGTGVETKTSANMNSASSPVQNASANTSAEVKANTASSNHANANDAATDPISTASAYVPDRPDKYQSPESVEGIPGSNKLVRAGDAAHPSATQEPSRGFDKGYEGMADDFYTGIDVERLVHDLKDMDVKEVYTSMDAGHYVCDYTYYCSLAEAKRTAQNNSKGKHTKVLFMHCPPANQPLSTEQVTDAIKKTIVWVSQTPDA